MKFIDSLTIDDNILTSTTVAEDDYSAWDIATAYTVGDRVISAATHSVYQCLVANTGQDPDAERIVFLNKATADPDPMYWGYVSATNPYRMFDQQPTTYTSDSSTIDVRITPAESVGAIAIYGLQATSVDIVITDPTDGEIYNETVDLTFSDEIADIWQYFTAQFLQLEVFVRSDLPALYPSAYIDLSFANTAGEVRVGEVDLGPVLDLGKTVEDGTYFERNDTSTIVTDDFGQVSDTQRPVLKISYFKAEVARDETQSTRRKLDTVAGAAKRTWIGLDDPKVDAIAYGYLDKGTVRYEDAHVSIVDLRVVGVL